MIQSEGEDSIEIMVSKVTIKAGLTKRYFMYVYLFYLNFSYKVMELLNIKIQEYINKTSGMI